MIKLIYILILNVSGFAEEIFDSGGDLFFSKHRKTMAPSMLVTVANITVAMSLPDIGGNIFYQSRESFCQI